MDNEQFLTFILFYIAGDGCLEWIFSRDDKGNPCIKLTYATITARDVDFLNLLRQIFHARGFGLFTISNITMNLNNVDKLNEAFRLVLNKMDEELIHPKLQVMRMMLNHQKNLPLGFFKPNTISFYEYVKDGVLNPLVNVVASDFYFLNIFELNAIVRISGYQEADDTRTFDVQRFTDYAVKYAQNVSEKTAFL